MITKSWHFFTHKENMAQLLLFCSDLEMKLQFSQAIYFILLSTLADMNPCNSPLYVSGVVYPKAVYKTNQL